MQVDGFRGKPTDLHQTSIGPIASKRNFSKGAASICHRFCGQLIWGGSGAEQVEREGMLTCLEGIPAGHMIDELGFYCQDEAGRPVGGALKGRLTFSWGRSTKKVTLQDETIVQLPPLQVC